MDLRFLCLLWTCAHASVCLLVHFSRSIRLALGIGWFSYTHILHMTVQTTFIFDFCQARFMLWRHVTSCRRCFCRRCCGCRWSLFARSVRSTVIGRLMEPTHGLASNGEKLSSVELWHRPIESEFIVILCQYTKNYKISVQIAHHPSTA